MNDLVVAAIRDIIATSGWKTRTVAIADGGLNVEVIRGGGRMSRFRASMQDYEDAMDVVPEVQEWVEGLK